MEPATLYDRPSNLDGEDSLSEIARLIAPGATVLDLGAATGKLGAYLRVNKSCTADGVELNPEAAAMARPHYRQLLQLDLEQATLADHFPAGAYDAIVCADVLEHLRDPGRVLDQLTPLLAPGGRVLISIPNVGYAGVVAGLVHGDFSYRPSGILDQTHVRFFTRSTLVELIAKHGFHALGIKPVVVPVQFSEFQKAGADVLAPGPMRALFSHPDALAYQFIVEAAPGRGIAPAPPSGDAGPHFTIQLYWGTQGQYAEAESSSVSGRMGERQSIELPIPARAAPPSSLRLDVGDRPGFVRLHSLSVHDAAGVSVWTWDGLLGSLLAPREMRVLAGAFAGALLCTGNDPSLELPVPAEGLHRLAGGGMVRVGMSWPLSADYALANTLIDERERAWQAERTTLLQAMEGLRRDVTVAVAAEARQHGLGRAQDLARRSERHEKLLAALDARSAELAHAVDRLSARAKASDQRSLRHLLRVTRKELLPARFDFELHPGKRLESLGDGQWSARGGDPHFILESRRGAFPSGWVQLDLDLALARPGKQPPHLYLDTGTGFSERNVIRLPRPDGPGLSTEVWLPAGLTAIRLDPTDQEGTFRLSKVSMRELGKLRTGARFAAPLVRRLLHEPSRIPTAASQIWDMFRSSGLRGMRQALVDRSRPTGTVRYDAWMAEFDQLRDDDRAAIAARIEQLPTRPVFSILMPVYNTPEKWLRRAIASVRGQLYGDWQLCIADDASTSASVRRVLEQLSAADRRIQVVFRPSNGHISAASNDALAIATGDFLVLLDHDDELAPHALYMLAEEIAAHP